MTKVKVKAITSFAHGSLDAHAGRMYEMNKGEAQELEKAGFVTTATEDDTETTPAREEAPEDLLGADEEGDKTEPPLENKMQPTHANKAAKTSKAK